MTTLTDLVRNLPSNVINATFEQAEHYYRLGLIDDYQWRVYQFIWDWGASRYSGPAGRKQEAYFRRRGGEGLHRRFAKVNRAVEAVLDERR